MDAESQLLADKDAEIERLLLKHAKEQNVLLTSLEAAAAEIERLNAEFDRVMYVSDLRAKRLDVCIPLITELCDALTGMKPISSSSPIISEMEKEKLIQRAREAVK